MRLHRVLCLLAALALAAPLQSCKRNPGDGCLSGAPGCRVPPPCGALTFTCDADTLELRTLEGGDLPGGGPHAIGARGDVLLGNGRVVAVLSAIGHQNNLDPNGGSLVDLMTRGGTDGLNQLSQVAGILPRDAVRYTSLELIDERPTRVAVQLRGHLDGHPEAAVATLYELRPCDPGVRIRTELVNGTQDDQLWTLTDGFYWYSQSLPFTPQPGAGFEHPPFSLGSVDEVYKPFPYLATSSRLAPQASYAEVGCNVKALEGFHSELVSASGLPRTVVRPRGDQVLERFVAVADAKDVGGAAALALEARRQLFGEQFITLSGRVRRIAGDDSFADDREASVVVSEGSLRTPPTSRVPWTQVVPGAGGAFSARVPAGRDYLVEVFAYGQKAADRALSGVKSDTDSGTFTLPSTARVALTVTEAGTGRPLDAEVYVVPADESTRELTRGTYHQRYQSCSPWLGPPPGGSPACNRVLVSDGHATVDVPPGRFHFYAFKGPFWTLQRQTLALVPTAVGVDLRLQPLPIQPAGTVSADLHVHGSASVDSSIPELDRVRSFSASEVQVIAATDHDIVHDYGQVVRQLGLQDRLSTLAGTETTGQLLFLRSPGSAIPLVIGHYNFWPLAYEPALPRAGGVQDEALEPGALFDKVKPLFRGPGVIQLNHPWADSTFGRDLGFPRAIGLSALKNLPGADDGTPQGLFVRAREGGAANDSHHAQEVMNGSRNEQLLAYRALWFYMLGQGRPRTGTANSDSHGLHDSTVGSPRNVVYTDTKAGPSFDQDRFDAAVRAGDLFGTNGPVIEATVDTAQGPRRFGMAPIAPAANARLHVKVSAAPWVPVPEVRVIVNGEVALRVGGLPVPADPFGTEELVRYEEALDLGALLAGRTGDAWLVVEAGLALPLAADLGGPRGVKDGIPDTTDNNGDGVVDAADVDPPGGAYGPMKNRVPPTLDTDPLSHFARVVPDGYPFAFTNPFLLDLDGNGRFDAPSLFPEK